MKSTTLLALASTAIFAVPTAEARVIKVEWGTPTVAFGGYSWPGVGQYMKITGTATAEVDPGDHHNSGFVDLPLAQGQSGPGLPGKSANGRVVYQFNFYILKPADLSKVDRTLNGSAR